MTDKSSVEQPKGDGSDAKPPIGKWIGLGIGAGIGSAAIAAALLYAGGAKKKPDQPGKP